jgi:hypothetical protein
LAWARHRQFTPSGRSALDAVLQGLALEPDDEVLITNSSGQMYVSACVTCTVFNHCQPSRVLTERTRAILVIHEYGYPHPDLQALRAQASSRGIVLIEDCAHSIDSAVDGAPLGSIGDFALFSLSKVLPIRSGGILVSAQDPPPVLTRSDEAQQAYAEHLPRLASYSRRRRRNCDAVRERFPDLPLLLDPAPGVTPFCVGLLTPEAADIKRAASAVEWGSTLREDLLLVPTNPLVEPDALVSALETALEPA